MYSVIATDANGCPTPQTVVITQADPITSSFSTLTWNNYEIQCNGGSNGEITLAVLGGVTALPYSFDIDGASNSTNVFNNISAGTYTLTATDANGCPTQQTVSMNEPSTAVVSSYTQSNFNNFGVHCNGDNDGWIDLTVNGGIGIHTYSWSNSASSEDLNGIGAGTYSVTATDENGCITQKTVVITEPSALISSTTQSNFNNFGVSCNGDNDGWIDLTVNGGVDNIAYTYSWSNGETTEDIDTIGANMYSVIATDANGCSTQDTVIITEPDVFVGGQLSASQTICQNDILDSLITISSPTGGNPPYTFDWEVDDGSGFVSLSNNNLDWFSPPAILDTIIYKIIYSDDYQCNTFIEFSTIIVNPLPISYPIIGDMIVCSNQSDASYTLSTTPINYRYEWFTNDGTIIGTNQSRNCLVDWPVNPNSMANIEVSVWVFETGCEILESDNIEISQFESPNRSMIVNMENTNVLVCNDTTLGVSYQWGYTNIVTNSDVIFDSDTLRYNQFLSVIDTLVNRYWVITSFNYGNDTCSTISYYNPPPEPLEIIDLNKELLFYPNPARDIVNWKGTSVDLIKLFDSFGRVVNCEVDYLNNKISLDNVRPGIYFLKYRSRNGEFINKLIVK